jgi:NAD+ synthase
VNGGARVRERMELNAPLAVTVLASFIRDAVETSGTAGVVIGLSGGIDSSLSAALAVRALGPERVHGFLLPYRTSSPASEQDARAVAVHLGIPHRLIDISPMVDAYFAVETGADPARRGNKMARERMSILFDQAKAENALVLGTSNKTEILLGYTTWFGDSAASLQPLGDLYKTQVRALSRAVGVPQPILEKKPSADLWPGQTDESELGIQYDEVDQVLYLLVDERVDASRVVQMGFSEALVTRVLKLVKNMQYKRMMPIIAKVGSRTPGIDFRYPRDWGR